MLTDIVVIDDVFDDPEYIIHKARGMEYYDKFNHPDVLREGVYTNYSGVRTELLHILDVNLYKQCNEIILNKIINNSFNYGNASVDYNFSNRLCFHYLTKYNVFNDSWFHSDNALCAGIVYLKKNPPKNSGTILKKKDEEIIVENKYNRLVLYNAGITHSPEGSFGGSVYDGRLTLTMFFDQLSFAMRTKHAS